MRNLFLTLAIILLTSPLFGGSHQPANLYRWETVSGIVWKGFGDKDINPQYLGEVDKGKPNGVGILVYPDGDKYVGEFKKGVFSGLGTKFSFYIRVKDDWEYRFDGEWKDGKMWNGMTKNKDGVEYFRWEEGKCYPKTQSCR